MDNDLVRVKSHIENLIDLYRQARKITWYSYRVGEYTGAISALRKVLLFIEHVENNPEGKQNERVD